MDLDTETLSYENLQQMSYSELRKVAAKYGIQRIMKADKLVSAVMSRMGDDNSFSSPAAKEINSSKKNKEKKFDEIQRTPLATPRRGTFTVETSSLLEPADLSSVSIAGNTSVLDMSNVTLGRGSERKLRPRKVSFISPEMTPRTPKSNSLRNRPKTPVASRTPRNGAISSASVNSLDQLLPTTPEAKISKFEINSDIKTYNAEEMDNSSTLTTSLKKAGKITRSSRAKLSPGIAEEETSYALTPHPASVQKAEKSVRPPRAKLSPKSAKRSATKSVVGKEPTSLKKKQQTPNFRRIHQKAFDKMESIDDYQKRKLLNSAKKLAQHSVFKSKVTKAKSKIPAFSGIPFVPSINRGTSTKLGSKANKIMAAVEKCKGIKENIPLNVKSQLNGNSKTSSRRDTPLSSAKSKFDAGLPKKDTPSSVKSKSKFDLKASLSRKLGYKPYRGPLKPLSAVNSVPSSSFIIAREPMPNKVITQNRSQTRSVVRGVRMNKRFELQMRNRKLD